MIENGLRFRNLGLVSIFSKIGLAWFSLVQFNIPILKYVNNNDI